MQYIRETPRPDKAILIHHGALGDFLTVWPAALSLARSHPAGRLRWGGPPGRLPWLAPLGITACPAEQRKALDRLYAATTWPQALYGHTLFWPVLDKTPDLAPHWPVVFLKGLAPSGAEATRQVYLKHLEGLGVPPAPDWLQTFQHHFAAQRNADENLILLFPGAGHVLKQWPLVQFFQLAELLAAEGKNPVFVLGPAELDRGMDVSPWPFAAPQSEQQLAARILAAQAVVGGDCGPMHLAGMLGVPGVSLFGPTSFAQWGPPGMRQAALGLACSPCTRACRRLDCHDPRCLSGITAEEVARLVLQLEGATKRSGFRGPGNLGSRLLQKEER